MAGRSTNQPGDYFAWAVQSAKDTEGSTFFFLKHKEGTGLDTDTQYVREREGGDGQEVGLSYKTKVTCDGAFAHAGRPEALARTLAVALGGDSATVITSPLTDHFLTPQASIPYLTVEQGWHNVVERVSNAKVNEVTLTLEAGRAWMVEGALLSAGTIHSGLSAQSPTRESNKPFYYPGASLGIAGGFASGAKVTRTQIRIRRGIDDGIQTNQLTREDLVELVQDYDADITCKYENAALWRQAHTNGGSLITPDIATTALTAFAAQGSFQAELQMPLAEITGAKVNKLEPDGKTMYLDLAVQSIKGATHPFYGRIRTAATAAYI